VYVLRDAPVSDERGVVSVCLNLDGPTEEQQSLGAHSGGLTDVNLGCLHLLVEDEPALRQ
jgi:hypothetical protein